MALVARDEHDGNLSGAIRALLAEALAARKAEVGEVSPCSVLVE